MEMLNIIFIAFLAIISANVMWEFLLLIWNYLHYHNGEEMINKDISLNEFLDNHNEKVKQIVYKIDGNYNGNIKGKNITVILMGDGNINGNINTKDGTVFLSKGNVNGDIKADKVLMPNKKKDVYYGRRGMVVRCPICNNTYTQNLTINGNTSEDNKDLKLDVYIDAEEDTKNTNKKNISITRQYVNLPLTIKSFHGIEVINAFLEVEIYNNSVLSIKQVRHN